MMSDPERERAEAGPGRPGAGRHRPVTTLVVTPSAIRRPRALAQGSVPKPLLRRGFAIAPAGAPGRAHLRLLFEKAPARYMAALLPFPLAMAIWPELALPISQAPLLMLILVLFIETSVLSIGSPEKRRALAERAEVARCLDLLAVRAREVLARIVAERGLRAGTLSLVVEQSAMARVRPFTLLSVQDEEAGALLDLGPEERALVAGIFDGTLTEWRLQRVNTATDTYLRSVALDARSVSAHARLEAIGRRRDRAVPSAREVEDAAEGGAGRP